MGTCFVVMGFGKKTDFESGRTFDLDKSYRNVIKPAVEAAGLTCLRADEIVHSGLIDVPMYEQLLAADLVIADLSTSNKNAFYELGIRHALRPYSTIVIAEDGLKIPFDVNHIAVRHYKHLGDDIGYDEVMRFRGVLGDAIKTIMGLPDNQRTDSPVYKFVDGLGPPAKRAAPEPARGAPAGPAAPIQPAAVAAVVAAAGTTHSALMQQVDEAVNHPHSALMEQVDEAVKRNDFVTAKTLLSAARVLMLSEAPDRREDPYIIQRLALLTYKSKHPTEEIALAEARLLLAALAPDTSNDTETLGLWGAIHKRLWVLTEQIPYLDEAVRAHERGFYLRNDYYNGINLAFLLNVRASRAREPADAIADFVLAQRVRKEVVAICQKWLEDNPPPAPTAAPQALSNYAVTRYWVLATMGEAMVGLGDGGALQQLDRTYGAAPEKWMADTTREQIARLQKLLADSPLKQIKTVP